MAGDRRYQIAALDGFRGFAALLVVGFHIWTLLEQPHLLGVNAFAAGGQIGIDVFFALSGFLLFLPMALEETFGSVKRYAARRAARLIPAYYVALAGMLALWPWRDLSQAHLSHPLTNRGGVFAITLHLVFAQTLVLGPVAKQFLGNLYVPGFGVDGVVWTLTTEACFYVVLPLVARWYRRHPLVGLAAGLGLSFAWRYTMFHLFDLVHPHTLTGGERLSAIGSQYMGSLPASAGQFACGMTAAWLYAKLRDNPPPWMYAAATVAALAFTLTWWQTGHDAIKTGSSAITNFNLYASEQLAAATFVVVALGAALCSRSWLLLWSRQSARWVGDRAYGIYLAHIPILLVLHRYVPNTWPELGFRITIFGVTLSAAIFLGHLSYRYVERPFMDWSRRHAPR